MTVAPKRPKGPPLNALRAFEAAARHVSFVGAAEELNVTPGAISQHVKTLEDWANTPLFRRNAQGVELTSQGALVATAFTSAFDRLADATRALNNLKPVVDFHIATLPAIAQLWLPARLSQIRSRFPHMAFSVTAMETPPRLGRELFDLSIFFGVPDGSQDQVVICQDDIVPVCAPAALGRDIGGGDVTRLHDQTWADDWSIWSNAVGMALPAPQTGPQFSLYSLAVEEAKAGAGVLIGHSCLIETALADGSLVRADDRSCTTGRSLIAGLPPRSTRRPQTSEVVGLLQTSNCLMQRTPENDR